jgi:ribosomal protein L37AE/L43A
MMTLKQLQQAALKIVIPFQKADLFIACPICGKGDFEVSHLKPGAKWGPWFCRHCNGSFYGENRYDGTVAVQITDERRVLTDVTLKSTGPVTLVVKGTRYYGGRWGNPTNDENRTLDEYRYNEGTCPTNYLADVIRVIDETGEEDPHGVFAYVRTDDHAT